MNKRVIGSDYESVACALLEGKGYEILEKNYYCKLGEIDIVARKGDTIIFCEVKYRKNSKLGHPLESVDMRKQGKIIKVARYYINSSRNYDYNYRFDVIGILNEEIIHIENAFEI